VSFTGGSDGATPICSLIADANGDLFGTTRDGANGVGTVFELVKSGSTYTLNTLATFTGSNGSQSVSGVIADANGDLFGTTQGGGANNEGTVFELVKSGSTYTLNTLVSFIGSNGAGPAAPPLADANGDLFGTTSDGGANGDFGTVFELVKNGSTYTLNTLASFNGSDGSHPTNSLIADANGDLFGTTQNGGANNEGTVFELVKSGSTYTLTTVVSFSGGNGVIPIGGLMSYGYNPPDAYRQSARLVVRILKGDRPSDLPFERPARYELIVNLKTAKAIGLTIPDSFVLLADEVIE